LVKNKRKKINIQAFPPHSFYKTEICGIQFYHNLIEYESKDRTQRLISENYQEFQQKILKEHQKIKKTNQNSYAYFNQIARPSGFFGVGIFIVFIVFYIFLAKKSNSIYRNLLNNNNILTVFSQSF